MKKLFLLLALLPSFAFADSFNDSEYKKIDSELNESYQNALKLYPSSKNQLIQSQRDWLKFANSECAYKASIKNNLLSRPSIKDCFYEMSVNRTNELNLLPINKTN